MKHKQEYQHDNGGKHHYGRNIFMGLGFIVGLIVAPIGMLAIGIAIGLVSGAVVGEILDRSLNTGSKVKHKEDYFTAVPVGTDNNDDVSVNKTQDKVQGFSSTYASVGPGLNVSESNECSQKNDLSGSSNDSVDWDMDVAPYDGKSNENLRNLDLKEGSDWDEVAQETPTPPNENESPRSSLRC